MFGWFNRKEPEEHYTHELKDDLTWKEFYPSYRKYMIRTYNNSEFFKVTKKRFDEFDKEEQKVWKKIK